MSQTSDRVDNQALDNHPLVVVMRLIAQSAPQPWYPYRAEGLRREVLDDVLEDLWLQELIQKAPSSPESGPAVTLTPLGERVVAEPDLLARLLQGQAIDPNSPAAVTRANISNPPRVWVCKVILAVNIAVFLWGLSLASRAGVAQEFFWGFTRNPAAIDKINDILRTTGSLAGIDLLRGEWHRLITSGFNHGGAIHLGMNMWALYAVGWFIEQRWGWWRFLVIYFLAIWTGSCLAMAYHPGVPVVGASGGLFGIFAAVIGWLLLYGKYLPAAGRRRAWQNVMTNVLLLAVMSFMLRDYVSHWGHGGGALGGFVSCFVLHAQRFGPPLLRLAAVPLILLLPLGGWATLNKKMADSPRWERVRGRNGDPEKAEKEKGQVDFERVFLPAISRKCRDAVRAYDRLDDEVIGLHPTRREAEKVKEALATLAEKQPGLTELAEKLEKHPPYADETVEEARTTGLALVQAVLELYAKAEEVLNKGKAAKQLDTRKLKELRVKVGKRLKSWNKLLE